MTPASNSQLLRTKIDLFSGALDAEADRFWNHCSFPEVYKTYLYHSHSVIRATVPLMRAAIQSYRQRHADHPSAPAMIAYLEQHAVEETGHDDWILDDAEALGLSRREVLEKCPSQVASHIVGAQYYWINHFHPLAMVGYIAVMEGNPSTPEFFDQVAIRNNLPPECISSFRYHAQIDPTHKQDLDNLIDDLPLTTEEAGLIGLSALRTIEYLSAILQDVNASA